MLKIDLSGDSSAAGKGKRSVSKGNTPVATTAANSRGTQSPVKKFIKEDGKRSATAKSVGKKPSLGKNLVENSPQVPKGLKSSFKSNLNLSSCFKIEASQDKDTRCR